MDINDYLRLHRNNGEFPSAPVITCNDGFRLSVQANKGAYCTPRQNKGPFVEVEVGYPSTVEPLLIPYAEGDSYTDTVYPYTPSTVVDDVIAKHGGYRLPEAPTKPTPPTKPWAEFNRRHTDKPFYGCLDKNGEWFDSSDLFETACMWCAYSVGAFNQTNYALWMEEYGIKYGFSIVHSDMLRRMYEVGLVK